ncbi:hypothetical protein HG530_013743 [Fusarium avenaceum]|nr:hypothetical protein HG530_013743 [Fusarium avenaceum]
MCPEKPSSTSENDSISAFPTRCRLHIRKVAVFFSKLTHALELRVLNLAVQAGNRIYALAIQVLIWFNLSPEDLVKASLYCFVELVIGNILCGRRFVGVDTFNLIGVPLFSLATEDSSLAALLQSLLAIFHRNHNQHCLSDSSMALTVGVHVVHMWPNVFDNILSTGILRTWKQQSTGIVSAASKYQDVLQEF